jgi:hypothetical protein
MIDKTTPMRNIPAIQPGIEGYWSGQRYWPVDETPELVRQATAHYHSLLENMHYYRIHFKKYGKMQN